MVEVLRLHEIEVGSCDELLSTMIKCDNLNQIVLHGSFHLNFDLIIRMILSKAELWIEIFGGVIEDDIIFEYQHGKTYRKTVLFLAREIHFKCSDLVNFFTQVKGFTSIKWNIKSGVSNEMAFAIAEGNPDLTKIEVNHRSSGTFNTSESLAQIFKHCSKLTGLHFEQDDYTRFDDLIAFFSSPFVKIVTLNLWIRGILNDDDDDSDEDDNLNDILVDDNLVYSDIAISILSVNPHIRELSFISFGDNDMQIADKARVADYIRESNREINFSSGI
jgi:hypothetical protein